ncbi:MAG: bifunctional folylpolyglutamate synthase/dihydrofolate synthase [Candidatus Aminicenantes bacterium]|nr:bifunctional folylpolyglutamate synthase/dihydrofolate synthase [Candidatus Aminicenantes bacterium]
MNYSESILYLKKIQEQGIKLELNNIKKVIDHIPFNLKPIKFIQVAGTNGKGSTSHFITSILQAAQYRVGLFTSPHLQDIRERITINKKWISKADFSKSLDVVRHISNNLIKQHKIDNIPTFFEHLFLVSLYYFYIKKVDFAIFEVGLGGRLDATSTIIPEVSVITNISYDHTKTLGKRIKDIAFEKAGIIKKNIPIVCGCSQHSISKKVIEEVANQRNAPFHEVITLKNGLTVKEKKCSYSCTLKTKLETYNFNLLLNGKHQAMNASTAIRVIEILNRDRFQISKPSIYRGIRNNFVPGRIEIIKTIPGIILDGSHNVGSMKALNIFLEQKNLKNLTLIFGVLRDKNYKKMISLLNPFINKVILTEPISRRALPAETLVKFFDQKEVHIMHNIKEALDIAKKFKQDILITGSLYLVGEMRNIIFGGVKNGYR